MKTAEEINVSLLGSKIQWFDRVGLLRIGKANTAKIILSTRERDGNFVGYKINIVNKENGVIDGKFFKFRDYFKPRLTTFKKEYALTEYQGMFSWIIEPEDTEAFKKAILKYIAYFD